MYMTRLALDPGKRETRKALANPNEFHRTVENAFPGEKKRRLWRVDGAGGRYQLLIASEDAPDMSRAAARLGAPGARGETKDYGAFIDSVGEGRMAFKLTANPAFRRNAPEGGPREKVRAPDTEEGQKEWLERKGAQNGFSLDPDGFEVVEREWVSFPKAGGTVSVLRVTYEGALTVTDAEAFRRMLREGIGRAKAYGMGMMTVARPRA